MRASVPVHEYECVCLPTFRSALIIFTKNCKLQNINSKLLTSGQRDLAMSSIFRVISGLIKTSSYKSC